jgi:hypothetical protein
MAEPAARGSGRARRVAPWHGGRFLLLAGLALLAGCSTQTDLRKEQLAVLSARLPGNYVNDAQQLAVLRIAAPLVGDNVFYVHESAPDDPRRVFSARVWDLAVAADARLVATVYQLAEPDRWRAALESPEMFRALLLRDLRWQPACRLLWQPDGAGYAAASEGEGCTQRWRLEADAIAFSDAAAGGDWFRLQRQR